MCRNLHLYGDNGDSDDFFCNFPSGPFSPPFASEINNVWAASFVPLLVCVAYYELLPMHAMEHVRTLSLTINHALWDSWPSDLVPKMTLLQDVVLSVDVYSRIDIGVARVFEVLGAHKNRPRVHLDYLIVHTGDTNASRPYEAFELEWAQFRTLNVVTLHLYFCDHMLPKSFFYMIREFRSLKSLRLHCNNRDDPGFIGPDSCRPTSHVLDLLDNFPDLEHLEFVIRGTQLELPSSSRLTHLSAPIDTFTSLNNRFEMFDNITHLQIITARLETKVLPNLRNLTTLALNPAGDYDERLLEHFVANNPKLVNLYLKSVTVSISLLKRALAKIQCLHVCDMTWCDLKSILPNAPNLCELSLTLSYCSSELRQMLCLDWLVDTVEAGTVISPKLAIIQANVMDARDGFPSWSQVPIEDLRCSLMRQFPQEALKDMFLPVLPIDSKHPRMFVIDLWAMAKWTRLEKAGN